MKRKSQNRQNFSLWVKIGAAIAVVLVGAYYGIPPFNEAKPEVKVVAGYFIVGTAIVAFVLLLFYAMQRKDAILGSKIDGFLAGAGVISFIIKFVATGDIS